MSRAWRAWEALASDEALLTTVGGAAGVAALQRTDVFAVIGGPWAVAPVSDTLVFLGPTLARDQARRLLPAEYHPPARMGDVYRLLSARVGRLVIIDGVFHGVPSLWHREILDALAEGVEVIGASSLGALRAAELHRFGMIGCGTIFRWYRDGVIDGDDEVALVHGDEALGFQSMSAPLVNLRATLAALRNADVLGWQECAALVDWLKALPYTDRSVEALTDCPVVREWPIARAARFVRSVRAHFVDLKRADAIEALRHAAAATPSSAGVRVPQPDRPERVLWNVPRSLYGTIPSPRGRVAGQRLLTALDDPALAASTRAALARRTFLGAWARARGVRCPADVLAKIEVPEPSWLEANGLTAVAARRLLTDRAIEAWLCREGPSAFGLAPTTDPAHAFVADWARSHGVARDAGSAATDEAVAQWLLTRGPAYVGLPFFGDAALVDELRLSGRAAMLAERVDG